ncbi:MAG: hypothetical protein ACT4PM_04510 [Gemmatimonadales bacterium]
MTYLHRLARRISRFRTPLCTWTAMLAACSQGDRVDFLSPFANPNKSVLSSIQIEPKIAAAPLGSEFAFTAKGLTASGEVVPTTFVWSADGGSIDPEGRYVGAATGAFRVIVRALQNQELGDTAVIAVWQLPTDPTGLVVEPDSVEIEEGDTLSFRASVSMANGMMADGATVNWKSTGGEIDQSGRFTSPSSGDYTVTATASNGLKGEAKVRVRPRHDGVIALSVGPATALLAPGQGSQFVATATWRSGRTGPLLVEWTASGGSITSGGTYTAGQQEGTFEVIGASYGANLADTATVTIARVPPLLVSLQVTPKPVAMPADATVQFGVTGTWSDNSTGAPAVTWSATGGTITSAGLYTAGSVAGTYRAIANYNNGSKADTASITISPSGPTLTVLGISPKTAAVPAGGSQQFQITASWSDGTTTPPYISWSATGGSISGNGLYTAGATPGTYAVVATGGTRSDTATVTVTSPASVLQSLTVSPNPASVPAGEPTQFSVAARWSDGSTTLPLLSWSATGGTVTTSGLYLAGATAGTFSVVAAGGGKADTAVVNVTTLAPPPPPPPPPSTPVLGCANPQPAWIWCDDFEQDHLSTYFEYDNDGGDFARAAGVGTNGSTGMRGRWQAGEVGAGALRLAFGRTPSSYLRPVDAGTSNYREIYWRMYVRNQSGWTGGGGDKLSRAIVFVAINWSEAVSAHVWSGGSGSNYLTIDPASGTDEAGNLRSTGYNDFTNWRWLGGAQGQTPIFSAAAVGQWYCVESHVRLNTAGQSDGVFELWINDALEAQRTGLNWVGGYSAYGINSVFFENYWNNGSPVAQERYFDDIVVSTQRVGCSSVSAPPSPSSPTLVGLTVAPKSASLLPGALQLFTAAALWSDGTTTLPSLNWSATGGTISSSGLYTAGATAGTYQVTVTGGGKSATATVTLGSLPPPPPPSGGAPLRVFDPENYTNPSTFLADSRAQWSQTSNQRPFVEVEEIGVNQTSVTLAAPAEGGYNGRTRVMRYNFPQTSQSDYTISRGFALGYGIPDGTMVWVEHVVRFAPNFGLSYLSGAGNGARDYKITRLARSSTFPLQIDYPGNGLSVGTAIHPAEQVAFSAPNIFQDGNWHTMRMQGKWGPNGVLKFWVDGVLVYTFSGNIGTNGESWYLSGPRNCNKGWGQATYMDVGLIQFFTSDPGWR